MPGGEMGDEKADTTYVEREVRRLSLSIDDARAREGSGKARPGCARCIFRRATRTA